MRYTNEYWDDVKKVIGCISSIEKIYGKRVLVTGATGMVCSAVVDIIGYLNKEFKSDIKLFIGGRNSKKVKERFFYVCKYTFVPYDAMNISDIYVDVDYIIHGASNANPSEYEREPVETLLGNIIGVNSMLRLAQKSNARLLYISSSEVYGNKKSDKFYEEKDYGFIDILDTRACYPNGKRTAETLCISYGYEYGVDTVIVRPGHIYGPSIRTTDVRASAQFTRSVLQKEDIIMKSAGTQLRSYCYTLDCASAIITVLLNGKKGEAYNISNKESVVTVRQLAEALAEYTGTRIVFENPSDIEMRGYNRMTNSALNAEKLEALGWKALFNLKDGVKKTIDIMKSSEINIAKNS